MPRSRKKKYDAAQEVARLCYAEGNKAWFTTRQLNEQWGDYWGESSYKRVSGHPYLYTKYDKSEGIVEWDIFTIEFVGSFATPEPTASVERINSGALPWLVGESGKGDRVEIFAGVSMEDFAKLISKAGGSTSKPNILKPTML